MEYQKIANLLGNASNQPSTFRRKNWVETNDESSGWYTTLSDMMLLQDEQMKGTKVYYFKIVHHLPNAQVK